MCRMDFEYFKNSLGIVINLKMIIWRQFKDKNSSRVELVQRLI